MSGVAIRSERPDDVAAVRAVTIAAFRDAPHSSPSLDAAGEPGEAALLDRLRTDPGWIPKYSLVAEEGREIVGHIVATRGFVDAAPALGLGPVSVAPGAQGHGVGSALVRALLSIAAARGETLVGLLGDPAFYRRFGFRPAADLGVEAPNAQWGDFFQARRLGEAAPRGRFRYAAPFERI